MFRDLFTVAASVAYTTMTRTTRIELPFVFQDILQPHYDESFTNYSSSSSSSYFTLSSSFIPIATRSSSSSTNYTRPIQGCWKQENRESSLSNRPFVNASCWKSMQDTYRQIVGEQDSSILPSSSSSSWSYSSSSSSGMKIPYEIQHSPIKGRGIYTTSKIHAGDVIWEPVQHAVFPTKQHYFKFIFSLPYDLACDVLQWSYVEKKENCTITTNKNDTSAMDTNSTTKNDNDNDNECYVVVTELDDGSFMNDSNHTKDDSNSRFSSNSSSSSSSTEIANVGFCNPYLQSLNGCTNTVVKGETSTGNIIHYALRDIEPGEEILVDYDTFDHNGELEWFDSMVDIAWWDPTT